MEKITIIDVAKKAGVGKSTVSRVLNNDENVKEETKIKVLEVIKELNYTPSTNARGMRTSSTRVIGIVASRLDSPSEIRAIRGMLEVIYGKGYDVVLVESLFDDEKTKEHIGMLINKKVEGIIIFAKSGMKYDYLKSLKMPIIMMAQEVEGFTSIVYDDYGAIEKIMDYFYKKNKRKIAYIGVDLSDETTGKKRYEAYKNFVEKNNMKNISVFSDFSYKTAYEKAKEILENKVEVIVCATDNISLGIRKYLSDKNIENIEVSGVGNNELIEFIYKNYVSVNLSFKQAGIKAGELIFDIIDDKECENLITMESQLILG
ncbi:MAG: HTH-type transcriptional regulator TreR [Fusobacteriaceae bacterium]|nr:HTH-type transcriptional regulator TreR [Fusobacteriaceae bacterium]MBN2838679.1 HTH-type transcriptional regulator TreR [Fusobacteriaceae bacterium]